MKTVKRADRALALFAALPLTVMNTLPAATQTTDEVEFGGAGTLAITPPLVHCINARGGNQRR